MSKPLSRPPKEHTPPCFRPRKQEETQRLSSEQTTQLLGRARPSPRWTSWDAAGPAKGKGEVEPPNSSKSAPGTLSPRGGPLPTLSTGSPSWASSSEEVEVEEVLESSPRSVCPLETLGEDSPRSTLSSEASEEDSSEEDEELEAPEEGVTGAVEAGTRAAGSAGTVGAAACSQACRALSCVRSSWASARLTASSMS